MCSGTKSQAVVDHTGAKAEQKPKRFIQRVHDEREFLVRAPKKHEHRHDSKEGMGRNPQVKQDELVPWHHAGTRHYSSPVAKLQPELRPGSRLAAACDWTDGRAGYRVSVGEAGHGCGGQ
jgi:hypothetical protein